jgi:UPF0042 nucleotide-binding protein
MGWRVVDNLPPALLPDLFRGTIADEHDGSLLARPLCVVCDVRAGEAGLRALGSIFDGLRDKDGLSFTLLFLDASDDALVRRFKETRRSHPLFARTQSILDALAAEQDLLVPIRARADKVIDTSGLSAGDLRSELRALFGDETQKTHPITVTVASFGFKHGAPQDADLLFDVRFLRNPHYVDALRPFDGRDPAVERYVMADERTEGFLERLYDLVGWSLPHYVSEGKAYLTVAVGCTGGRHRSVVVAEKLARFVRERGYPVLTQHRDLDREAAVRCGPDPSVSVPAVGSAGDAYKGGR